jgi:hypothetical protein
VVWLQEVLYTLRGLGRIRLERHEFRTTSFRDTRVSEISMHRNNDARMIYEGVLQTR